MRYVGLLLFAAAWGQMSTRFFFNGWLCFLGSIYSFALLVRNRFAKRKMWSVLVSKVSETLFFAALLYAGFMVFYRYLAWGQTRTEVLVYLVSATVCLAIVLPRASTKIDDMLRMIHHPD